MGFTTEDIMNGMMFVRDVGRWKKIQDKNERMDATLPCTKQLAYLLRLYCQYMKGQRKNKPLYERYTTYRKMIEKNIKALERGKDISQEFEKLDLINTLLMKKVLDRLEVLIGGVIILYGDDDGMYGKELMVVQNAN